MPWMSTLSLPQLQRRLRSHHRQPCLRQTLQYRHAVILGANFTWVLLLPRRALSSHASTLTHTLRRTYTPQLSLQVKADISQDSLPHTGENFSYILIFLNYLLAYILIPPLRGLRASKPRKETRRKDEWEERRKKWMKTEGKHPTPARAIAAL